jgi:hypothetical protein
VVDPIKRITIADVRQHPWYLHKLPMYLTLAPELIEKQERYVDPEIVDKVCSLPIRGVNTDYVRATLDSALTHPQNKMQHDLRVIYELLLDEKRHKKRIEDVVMALQDISSTPPVLGSSPRILSLGASPSMSRRMAEGSSAAAKASGQENRPLAPVAVDGRDLTNRRRRWYLGIQSKKDPVHVMNEVYKAMQALKCVWHAVNNYRVLCLWTYASGVAAPTSLEDTSPPSGSRDARVVSPQHRIPSPYNNSSADVETIFLDGIDPERGDGMMETVVSPMRRSSLEDEEDEEEDEEEEADGNDSGNDSIGMTSNSLPPARKRRSGGQWRVNHGTSGVAQVTPAPRVKTALSLYKVQQGIYLLDFQRVEVSKRCSAPGAISPWHGVFLSHFLFCFCFCLCLCLCLPTCVILTGTGRLLCVYEAVCVHSHRTQELISRESLLRGCCGGSAAATTAATAAATAACTTTATGSCRSFRVPPAAGTPTAGNPTATNATANAAAANAAAANAAAATTVTSATITTAAAAATAEASASAAARPRLGCAG